ncbi:MAG: glycosyltransferase [Propionibacteriaceae bacterium]|jgi:GT2 family glycosyltransferase|nr:glycosyltransferase [Propionibacteriaceae bacterium]
MKTVVAVVVAYNRADLLKEALDGLAAQSRPVDEVLVVDNDSTDDTYIVATSHPIHAHVVRMTRNIGGAGGFAAGLDLAVRRYGADLAWLMDDDTIPTATALEELLNARDAYGEDVDIAGSKAVWTDGAEHPMNTPRARWRASATAQGKAARASAVPVRTSSFVSMLVSAEAVWRVGLPKADFFIWNDDFEYSARVLRDGVGIYVPASVVVHKTKKFGSSDTDPGERFYYEVRNKIWTLTSGDFGCLDWFAYSYGTARRWVRTFRKSENRRLLCRVGAKGLVHGLFQSPRPTGDVIEEALPWAM